MTTSVRAAFVLSFVFVCVYAHASSSSSTCNSSSERRASEEGTIPTTPTVSKSDGLDAVNVDINDLDWSELSSNVQKNLMANGWTAETWDADEGDEGEYEEEAYSEFGAGEDISEVDDVDWDDLLPETRVHFESRGYTREKWNAEDASYQRLGWNELDGDKQQALLTLGWKQYTWDAENEFRPHHTASERKPWNDLSSEEQEAAIVLGYSAETWHVRTMTEFNPVVTKLSIPELQTLDLDYFASLVGIKVAVVDGSLVGDDERCEITTMTMDRFITELRRGSKYYLKYEDEEQYKKYIQSMIGPKILHYLGDALRNSELRANGKFPTDYDGLPLTDYNWALFVGGTNTTTSMHFDIDTVNFLWVASGRKRVVMLPNDERTAGRYECLSQFSGHSCWTGVDILHGSPPEHAVEVEVGPGEGILFPDQCWHAVQNLEPTVAFSYKFDLSEYAIGK